MRSTQKGFTLIELVFVIVILGILAAFAIPRYVDLTVQARTAAVRGVEGAVRSASGLVHAAALATNSTASVTVESQAITLVNQYPAGTAAGIQLAIVGISASDFTIDTATAGTVEWEKFGATTPNSCKVIYVQSAAAGAPPTITSEVGGC